MKEAVCLFIAITILALAAGCMSSTKIPPPKPAPLPESQAVTDTENRPLTILPPDPPLPPGAEDLGDDSWAKDGKKIKLKDKDKNKLRNSSADDDSWVGD